MDRERSSLPPAALIVLAFATIYLVWGSTYLGIRYAVETIPPFLVAGIRSVIAGTVLFALTIRSVGPRPTGVNWRSAAIIGALLLLGGNGMVTWAQQTVPSGQAAVLVATEPLWVVILDWLLFRGARPSRAVVVGLICGVAGVFSLVGARKFGEAPVNVAGAIALSVACAAWAGGSLYSRSARLPSSPFVSASMQMLCGGGLRLIVSLLTGEWSRWDVGAVSTKSILAMCYLCVFGSLGGLTAYVWLLRTCSAAAVSTYAFVNPLVAVLIGHFVGGEVLSPRIFLATGLIGAAVLLVIFTNRQMPGAVEGGSRKGAETQSEVGLRPGIWERVRGS